MEFINVVIDDDNNFFASGLQLIIIDYAKENNKEVGFITPEKDERPDVVFVSSPLRAGRWRSHKGRTVMIREKTAPSVFDNGWGLSRCISQDELFTLLDRIFASNHYMPLCAPNPLTQRERQVVNYLRCGFDQAQTARILGVSVKTVHSHKRSIMSKLFLSRNHDFIYWLLAYGGEYS